MRLTPDEAAGIKAAAEEVFGPGVVVRLFGSRVDDARRGGDIDLLVEVPPGRDTFDDECALARALEDRIGERRVDATLHEVDRSYDTFQRSVLPESVVIETPPGAKPSRPARVYGWEWGVYVPSDKVKLSDVVAAGRELASGLRLSIGDLDRLAPLDEDRLKRLSRQEHKDVLAFLKVFEQLQDLTSNQLIRSILILSGEDVARLSARDAFDKAEKMGALEDAARFVRIAQLRHRLAHEYPMDAAARAKRVRDACALAPALLEDFDRLAAYAARFTQGDAR